MNISPPFCFLQAPNANNTIVLLFYIAVLITVIVIALRYNRSAMQKMQRARGGAPALDLYDLAFLSGGAQRMMQLAVFRLHEMGVLTFQKTFFHKRFIPIKNHSANHNDLTLLERNVYAFALSKGKLVALSDAAFRNAVKSNFEQCETKLAIAGHRPTAKERSTIRLFTMAPFVLLGILGVLRVFFGISHDYPVLYLVILLILTIIIGTVISAKTPKLTRSGKEVLALQKNKLQSCLQRARSSSDQQQYAGESFALHGAVGLMAFPVYAHLISPLQALYPSSSGTEGGDGGGGCGSSGCGSSGCGGSGCGGGGCGGGGGD